MPSRTLDICDISTRIVPVQKAFSLITRRSTKTDGPRIQAKVCAEFECAEFGSERIAQILLPRLRIEQLVGVGVGSGQVDPLLRDVDAEKSHQHATLDIHTGRVAV